MKAVIGITSDIAPKTYKLKKDYIRAVLAAGGLPVIISPVSAGKAEDSQKISSSAIRDYIHSIADLLDGLLLSGGNDVAPCYYNEKISVPKKFLKIIPKLRTEFELNLVKEMIKRQKPVLGICYGMQLLNVAFGGSLYQDLSYQRGVILKHDNMGHNVRVFQIHGLEITESTYIVNSSHHQAVKTLGEGLDIFALSDDNLIEGFYKTGYPFLVGVQWHPERMPDNELCLKILKLFIKKAEEENNKSHAI